MYALRKNGNGPIYVIKTKNEIKEFINEGAIEKFFKGEEINGWECIN
jgi:hypothetical protein